MNTNTLRRLYQTGSIVAFVLFVAMLIDHFANDSALLIPLVVVFALVALAMIGLLFVTPDDVRFTEPAAVELEGRWVDYPGDVHEVVDLEGIGPTYAQRLHEAGIDNTQELLFADDRKLQRVAQVPPKTVRGWKSMAQLIKVKGIGPQYAEALTRGGVDGIEGLKECNTKQATEAVNAYLDSLDSTVVGQRISEKRMTKWKRAAGRMKKVPIDMEAIEVETLGSKAARADATTA